MKFNAIGAAGSLNVLGANLSSITVHRMTDFY